MPAEEQILVIPATVIDSIGSFTGYRPAADDYIDAILKSSELTFLPRSAMEIDPSFKQLIPYVILQWQNADGNLKIFRYTRGGGGGETRLHAKHSIGIGGHISSEDAAGDGDSYTVGMQREIEEEVTIGTTYSHERMGLIYDPSNDVGKVHLGVVHRFHLDAPEVGSNEADLADGCFVTVDELNQQYEQLETWSQLVVKHVY